MKMYFLKLYSHDIGYAQIPDFYTKNFELQYLWFLLSRSEFDWIHLSTNKTTVLLWSSDNIKQRADIKFATSEKQEAFNAAYSKYSAQRWDDMPKLSVSLQNYEMIIQKWHEIIQQTPQYLIISQDDNGLVDLIGKEELSAQDKANMRREHVKFLKYQAAWEKYDQAHPDRSEVWSSPADSEYEVDWQKYLDEPLD